MKIVECYNIISQIVKGEIHIGHSSNPDRYVAILKCNPEKPHLTTGANFNCNGIIVALEDTKESTRQKALTFLQNNDPNARIQTRDCSDYDKIAGGLLNNSQEGNGLNS
jgi:hypothetical protein